MKIFIVILHIGDLQITKNCIASLEKNEKYYGEIVLVNNDRTTITPNDLPYKHIAIINNKKNLGFAGGVNRGIVYSLKHKADAILLLNNDTYIKKPFLLVLRAVFKQYPTVGIVGPAICFKKNRQTVYDIGGSINMWTGRTRHTEVRAIKGNAARFVTYVSGAAMCIKREVFEKIGLFDEHFFLYYEDADFCLRAKEKGFLVAVDPTSVIYHLLSKTIGKVNPFAVYHQTRSAVVFGRKYMCEFPKNLIHTLFLFGQTGKITLKHPRAGISGWKAMLQ